MEAFLTWTRIGLLVLCGLCLLGVVYELRTAWRWVIAPAIDMAEKPLRVQSRVGFVEPKANKAPAFTQSIGETRFRGSTGYIASATFDDEDGLLRIVHSEGLFSMPDKGRSVEVAYRPALPPPGRRPPPHHTATPTEAEGALLTFDILYGRACLYLFLAFPPSMLLLGIRFFTRS